MNIGADHDSVPGGPGANDGASGTPSVLDLARVFAQTPPDTEIRFLTFCSEERDLLAYQNMLPKVHVERMVARFQMDRI